MASYNGLLRIPNTRDAVDAVFDIGEDNLRVTTGGEVLGDWPLSDVAVEDRGDALLVSLAGEAVLVDIGDRDGFSAALTVAPVRRRGTKGRRPMSKPGPTGRSDRTRRSKKPVASTPVTKPIAQKKAEPAVDAGSGFAEKLQNVGALFSIDNWREWLQDRTVRWSIASIGIIVFAMLALFATDTLGMMLVLFGMLSLIIAALAVSEDLNAYRLVPNALSETGLVIVGAIAMVLGGILIVIG